MFPHPDIGKHEKKASQWVRTAATAFILAATATGFVMPEAESETYHPHTTREEQLRELQENQSEIFLNTAARYDRGAGGAEQRPGQLTLAGDLVVIRNGTHLYDLYATRQQLKA